MSVVKQAETVDPGTPVLKIEHLRKDFPIRTINPFGKSQAVHAVDNASFALYPGRATALVGESGSGKSTIARILSRLYDPTSGTISFNNEAIQHKSLREYRRQVQMIFQDPFSSLNPIHDLRYHLSRPLRIYGYSKSVREDYEQIIDLLKRVNLTPAEQFIEKLPHQLSGGQRQRVSIARALAVRPSVLLADEPVSMLDVSIRLDILNLLLRLKEQERIAVLFITHDIASARYFAEDTLVLYAGQMVEGGPSDELIQNAKHPYTQLLLAAAPDPDRMGPDGKRKDKLPARGEIPSLIHPPTGCRFHPRCPHAMPVCKEHFPGRTDLGNGHWTNCFLYGTGTEESPITVSATAPRAASTPVGLDIRTTNGTTSGTGSA